MWLRPISNSVSRAFEREVDMRKNAKGFCVVMIGLVIVGYPRIQGQAIPGSPPLDLAQDRPDVTAVSSIVQTTFTVINANPSGAGSLPQAIQDAQNSGGVDTIVFAIPGSGVRTITLGSGIAIQNDGIFLDGWSQGGPGYTGPPLIELNGNGAGGDGITVSAGNSIVRGLVINRFSGNGISLQNIGGSVIAGCYIGTDATGTAASPNGQNGIFITGGAANTIGGLTAAEGNVISGNSQNGIVIQNTNTTDTKVVGNFIGTNAAGTAAISNGNRGISIDSPFGRIGGGEPGARNIISGNGSAGILGFNSSSFSNKIQGNFIGTDVTGTLAIPNLIGVVFGDQIVPKASANNFIGTDGDGVNDATEGNVISGNLQAGIVLTAGGTTGNRISGNIVGLNAAGTAAVPNGGDGIDVTNGPSNNFIGANCDGLSDALEGNIVSGNGASGIVVSSSGSIRNKISGDSIFSNGNLGIDLGGDGITPNDTNDPDGGPNNLQNFPVITAAMSGSISANITLNSMPNTAFRVEVFSSVAADPSGNGEGQTFIGSINMVTDGGGNASTTFTSTTTVPVGQFLTTTATDSAGNTSEFSVAAIVMATTAAPVSVTGRVMTASGQGVSGAIVSISDAAGGVRFARTNTFGFYRFDGIQTGKTYVVQVTQRLYNFLPQVIGVNDAVSDLNFFAVPTRISVRSAPAARQETEQTPIGSAEFWDTRFVRKPGSF